jgi:hypothetical protein
MGKFSVEWNLFKFNIIILIYMYDVIYEVEIALCNINKDTLQLITLNINTISGSIFNKIDC